MPAPNRRHPVLRSRASGIAIVEFAIVAGLFFTLLLGLVDFGRWLFTLNAANEATRYGARVAVVCDMGSAGVLSRMQRIMPQLEDGQVNVQYLGTDPANPSNWVGGCSPATCAAVRVGLQGFTINSVAWFLPAQLPVPAYTTTLMRESLRSQIDGSANPICE